EEDDAVGGAAAGEVEGNRSAAVGGEQVWVPEKGGRGHRGPAVFFVAEGIFAGKRDIGLGFLGVSASLATNGCRMSSRILGFSFFGQFCLNVLGKAIVPLRLQLNQWHALRVVGFGQLGPAGGGADRGGKRRGAGFVTIFGGHQGESSLGQATRRNGPGSRHILFRRRPDLLVHPG